ncbi:UNC-like C-terminal-domain-containing protein [Phellopilus nigrolimitatus]|nr:UNC-like C-terminal-domain-containing protein [Phellopilus nigrolimitatus]
MHRLYLLPAGLLALLLSASALAEPVTPHDPFHDISKLAQRPPEPPICCLTPLPPSEPAGEILSFEDWKAKQLQQQQAEGAKLKDAAAATKAKQQPAPAAQEQQQQQLDPAEAPPDPPPPSEAPPHFRVPLTDRFNYASLDCSARVHHAHRSARAPAAILSEKKDRYMLSPCAAGAGAGEPRFVVVELCEDVRIDTVQLANFEFFSGVFRDFSVSVARTYETDPAAWTPAGTYRAKNVRGIQSFHPPTSLRDFYRFIRIDFHSHFGNEYYCPVSLLRVYGLTHLEQWKWDEWEAESQAKKGDAEIAVARSIASPAAPAAQDPGQAVRETADDSPAPADTSAENASPETADVSVSPTKAEHPVTNDEAPTSVTMHSATTVPNSMASDVSTSTLKPEQSSREEDSHSDTSSTSSAAESGSPVLSNSSDSSPSSTHLPPESAASGSPSQPDSVSAITQSSNSSASSSHASSSKLGSASSQLASSSISTIIPHETRAAPAVTSAGESIYRTIMTRLSLLEGNSTLHLRYVEEQARSMRDALRRLEEDVGRLEGIGKAHSQFLQKTVQEWERQRKRLEREHGELLTRVNILSDEVVLEKRLGIAQLCLLLTVLVFMALTRGSRGEPIIGPMSSNGRRDSLKEWGRRHLSSFSSGEWASKLRNRSPTPRPVYFQSPVSANQSEKVKFPTERSRDDGERTPKRTGSTLALSSPAKPRTPAAVRTPHARQFVAHRPGTPSSAALSIYSHVPRAPGLIAAYAVPGSSGGGGSARPRLRRANSHSSPAAAAMAHSVSTGLLSPLPPKKWAKSAHLHEIRKHPRPGAGTPEREQERPSGVPVEQERNQEEPENARQEEGRHVFWPSTPPDTAEQGRLREHDGGRAPLSVSALQNRAREQDGTTTLEGLALGSPWQPNDTSRAGPKVVEIDTESESWVDTDVEGSEVSDRSP